jgi:carbon storage regulator CsrA
MLVLSRKASESIRIGPDIVISVLAIQGNRVRLGVSAPTDIAICRTELTVDGAALPVKHSSWLSEAHQGATF